MTLDELKRLIAEANAVVPDDNEDLQILVNKEAASLILEGIAPDLAAQVVRLTEALEFYADLGMDGYDTSITDYGFSVEEGHIICDRGQRARATLEALK